MLANENDLKDDCCKYVVAIVELNVFKVRLNLILCCDKSLTIDLTQVFLS